MVFDYNRLVKHSRTRNFASTSCLACDISALQRLSRIWCNNYLHDHDMITAVTDNKLLETILAKSINSTPKRLQGLMLRLIDMVIEFLKRILMKQFKRCGLKYLLLKRKILFVVSAGSTTHRNVFRNTLKKQSRSSLLWVSRFAFSVILTSTF